MYCTYCGTEIVDTASFCQACGKKTVIKLAEQPTAEAPIAQPAAPIAQPAAQPAAAAPASQATAPYAQPAMQPTAFAPVATPTAAKPASKAPIAIGAGVVAAFAVLAIVATMFLGIVNISLPWTSDSNSSTPAAVTSPEQQQRNDTLTKQTKNFIPLWLDGWDFQNGQFSPRMAGTAYLEYVAPGSEAAEMLPKGLKCEGDSSSAYTHENIAYKVFEVNIIDITDNVVTAQAKYYTTRTGVTQEMYDKMVEQGGQSQTYVLTFNDDNKITAIAYP